MPAAVTPTDAYYCCLKVDVVGDGVINPIEPLQPESQAARVTADVELGS